MTRQWQAGEPIEMECDERGRPTGFRWRGKRHGLHRIRQRWTVDTDWWSDGGRVHRDYLAVTTLDGLLCVIYHDRLDDEWRLARLYD
jgi:hypothetical protein